MARLGTAAKVKKSLTKILDQKQMNFIEIKGLAQQYLS